MKFALSCDENPGDPGTTAGGVTERTMNIRVAQQLELALRRCRQAVWFDPTISFVERVAKANAGGYDVLFACAHNAASSAAAEGAQFIFCGAIAHHTGKQALAATNVGNELVKSGVVLRWGTYDENVYECCNFNKDTVYCEFLFQTNPRDLAEERRASYPHDAAEAACRGLSKTYGFAYVPVAVPAPKPPPTPKPVPPPVPVPVPPPTPVPEPVPPIVPPTPVPPVVPVPDPGIEPPPGGWAALIAWIRRLLGL